MCWTHVSVAIEKYRNHLLWSLNDQNSLTEETSDSLQHNTYLIHVHTKANLKRLLAQVCSDLYLHYLHVFSSTNRNAFSQVTTQLQWVCEVLRQAFFRNCPRSETVLGSPYDQSQMISSDLLKKKTVCRRWWLNYQLECNSTATFCKLCGRGRSSNYPMTAYDCRTTVTWLLIHYVFMDTCAMVIG